MITTKHLAYIIGYTKRLSKTDISNISFENSLSRILKIFNKQEYAIRKQNTITFYNECNKIKKIIYLYQGKIHKEIKIINEYICSETIWNIDNGQILSWEDYTSEYDYKVRFDTKKNRISYFDVYYQDIKTEEFISRIADNTISMHTIFDSRDPNTFKNICYNA